MRKLKVLISTLLITVIICTLPVHGSAASNITIIVDGKTQSYGNQAKIQNGTTLVPLRGIFEALGADVTWNQVTKTIDVSKGSLSVWLKIGSNVTKVNGQTVNISVPAQVDRGVTVVPLRFISEALGSNVNWDQKTKTITITQGNESKYQNISTKVEYLDDHFYPFNIGFEFDEATILKILGTPDNVLNSEDYDLYEADAQYTYDDLELNISFFERKNGEFVISLISGFMNDQQFKEMILQNFDGTKYHSVGGGKKFLYYENTQQLFFYDEVKGGIYYYLRPPDPNFFFAIEQGWTVEVDN